jgi:hypothetical protein
VSAGGAAPAAGAGADGLPLWRRLWRWSFPEPVEPPPAARAVLARVYPTLDLSRVGFHRGLPHVLNLFAIEAITLPATLSLGRTRVYFRPRAWDPDSTDGVALLLHEAFHALQLQESGRGPGLLRPFIVLYLACAAANRFRYAGHPLEEAAYEVAGRAGSRFERGVRAAAPAPLAEGGACAATASSGLVPAALLAAGAPGGVRALAPPWLLLWALATAVLWLAALAVEAACALAAGLLRVTSAPLRFIRVTLYRN